ncbi:calmodulin-regulated spectrin-associated protein 3-like, partial [Pyrgilauda ruficollis]|uniref:calmodulin-regulated spectrin-associated protein 3-like n=1 Tax=Pyrgilauda ruficollis TaxID=221976 RepID=UPI001B8861D9
ATPATPPGVPNGVAEPPEPPSIEEALQIIHSSERLLPDGAPDAFFLHSPEPPPPQNPLGNPQNLSGNSSNLSGNSQNPPGTPQNPPQNPLQNPTRPMTSFAERKKKLEEATSGAPANPPGGLGVNLGGVSTTPGGPPEAGGGLSAEMSQLGARLEEKRRAIEAQKKRIEAIFAKHRQRLGQNALQRLRHDEEGASPAPPEEELSLGASQKPPQAPPGQYEAAVARLSAALSSLQLDMQRLTQQQERLLLEQRPHGAPQAWVIPLPKSAKTPSAPPKNTPGSPAPARRGGGGGGGGSNNNNAGNSTPAPAGGGAAASVAISAGGVATGGSRKPPPRSPRRPRPAELRLPPLTRVLTPPHDVDTLPHLRRFSPSQVPVQTRSSLRFADGQEERDEDEERPPPAPVPPESPPVPGKGTLRARACGDGTSDVSLSPGDKGTAGGHRDEDEEDEEEEDEEEEEEGEGDSLEGSPTEGGSGGTRASVGFFCKLDDTDPSPPRRDFTRLEYERRQQLKLMEELEKVLRPPRGTPAPKSAAGGGGGNARGAPRDPHPQIRGGGSGRARPRCCDDSALGRSPPKGLL